MSRSHIALDHHINNSDFGIRRTSRTYDFCPPKVSNQNGMNPGTAVLPCRKNSKTLETPHMCIIIAN